RGTAEEALPVGEAHELPLDGVDKDKLVEAADRLIGLMMHRVAEGNIALRKLELELYPPGGPRRPQVSFRIGSKVSGVNPWYDVLSDYNQRVGMLLNLRDRVASGRGMEPQRLLRNRLLDAWMRERLIQAGKLDEVVALNKHGESILYEDVAADT